jgi:hypothetical protein
MQSEWLSVHLGILAEDHVLIDPAIWSLIVECSEDRKVIIA